MKYVIALVIFMSACGGAAVNNSANKAANSNANVNSGPTITAAKVTIDSADGVKLVGTYLTAPKPNSPALLLLHQWQSDRHSYDDFAKRMHERGFAVLSIDGRGFGESTRKADGSTISAGRSDADVKAMLGDVDASLTFLKRQPNVDPSYVGVVGASYGSSLVLLYGASHPSKGVWALISPGLNYFGNMPTEPALQRFGSDCAIFMAAAKDDPESAKAVETLVSQWTFPQEMITKVIVEKGGHGTALLETKVADELDRFLTRYLLKN
jgi:dienelactone hydrolase